MRGTPQAKRKLQEALGDFEERHKVYGLYGHKNATCRVKIANVSTFDQAEKQSTLEGKNASGH